MLFSSEGMEREGMPMSETVTAHARLRDASARQGERMGNESEDQSRGGPAARSTLSPGNGKREGSRDSQENRAI